MPQDVQLEVTSRITSCSWCEPNKKPGDLIWVSPSAAQHLIDAGLARYLQRKGYTPSNQPDARPSNAALAAPREAPSAEPDEKKVLLESPDWPIDRYCAVNPEAFRGDNVLIVGGGPSATAEAVGALAAAGWRVIGVNNAYTLYPDPDLLYFADARWYEWHKDNPVFKRLVAMRKVATIRCTGGEVQEAEVQMFRQTGDTELSDEPNALHTGCNGGYQALNIAYLGNPRFVALIGFDMNFPGGKSHFHTGHPIQVSEKVYSDYARRFDTTIPQFKQKGIDVVNLCATSAIKAFPKVSLESLLHHP